jgi:hypothetical protein
LGVGKIGGWEKYSKRWEKDVKSRGKKTFLASVSTSLQRLFIVISLDMSNNAPIYPLVWSHSVGCHTG